ncbi:interferon-induced protein 44-like [Ruditapes philippinarum]|uniref:interferon-induced protein 44-like n=1 Tax=Ruditapes philippinarum TaxID=129788 RepID=UPI00295B77E1|nr:interferon-induced protein 44-like [Ruditapes philippinarum]
MYQSIEGHLKHHTDMKVVPEGWKSRQDVLPDWRDDIEKRNLLSERMLPFEGRNLRILLVGPVESGKSSFIDSVQSALRSKIVLNTNTGSAGAMTDNPVSTTEKFKLYNIEYVDKDTGATRRSGIYLGDTPGFQEQDGIKEDHVKFIISGNVPDGFKIINGIQDSQDDFQRDPQPGDKIHCVCFVFDCEKILKGLSEAIRTSMRKLRRDLIDKGCPYIVILTKCDKVSNSLKTGRQRIFLDSKINECKDKLKGEFGFRQQQVYPIVNYEEQNVVDKQTDRLILAAFFEILELGNSHMERAAQQE